MNKFNCYTLKDTRKLDPEFSRQPRALTIGNFDGCHLGHQKLISETLAYASNLNLCPSALSFNPRPKDFFDKANVENNLFTQNQKCKAFQELGLSQCFIQSFDSDFANLSHQNFLNQYLKESLATKAIVIGSNFKFGKNRLGSSQFIKDQSGFPVSIIPTVSFENNCISSTKIRDILLNEGDISQANKLLGRPYLIEAKVIKGRQLGRTIDIPTANFSTPEQLVPKDGVYCGYIHISKNNAEGSSIFNPDKDKLLPAVTNIGKKPTVDKKSIHTNVEAHILSDSWHKEELYGYNIGFYFSKRLRDEMVFPSLEVLKNQIKEDINQAKRILG